MRAIIAMTSIDQLGQGLRHILKTLDLRLEFRDVSLRQTLDLCTVPRFVSP